MTPEELIERVVHGSTPEARRCLLNLLVEVEKSAKNFDAVCQTPHVCREVVTVANLVALRHAIAFSLVRETLPSGGAAGVNSPRAE